MMPAKSILCRTWLCVLLFLGYTAAVFAQPATFNQPLPQDARILKGKFANGLTYYVRPNHKPEQKVELRLVVNAGSILEEDSQQGLAHFMEHMNFNGTKHFEKNELVSYLQSIGVEFGADLNAYTSFDETVFILPVPTDKPGNLDKGFQIIEDWAHNALLTDKDIDEERAVVLEESRLGKGAEQRMLDKYLPELMVGSQYAKRLPIGKDDILKTFKYDRIRSFYKDWYRPNLMAVVVVGDIDTATAMKYLRKHFATLANNGNTKRVEPVVPERNKPAAMVLTDKEATNYRLSVIFPTVKAPDEITAGDYRANIARQLALQIINRRLSDLARSSNPPYLGAGAGFDGWARGYENFALFVAFGNEGPESALNAAAAELLKVKEFGFSNAELELAKKNTMAGMERVYNERSNTESSDYADEYIRNFLEKEPIPGIEQEYAYYRDFVPGITVAELNAMIPEWLSNTNTFSLITGPENGEVKLPDSVGLVAITQKAFAQRVVQNEEKEVATVLMDKKPAGGKILKTQKEAGLDATTYTLNNGIKITIKQTDFKNDQVLLSGVKVGGRNNYGVADKSNIRYATAVAGTMGLAAFTPTDLEKVLAGKSVSAGVSIGSIENTVSASSTVKDMEAMFQLLYLRLMEPRMDTGLFKAFCEKQKTSIWFAASNPKLDFYDTTIKKLYSNNPLVFYPIPLAEDFDAIDVNRVLNIYRNEFSSADGYHFFIVGNVDEKTVLPLIETYIGSIPATGKDPAYKDNGVRPLKGKHVMKVYKGSEQQSFIWALYSGEVPYSEDLQLKAQAVVELLNIKVIEELREKLGGIYTGGYAGGLEKEPYERFSIALQLPCGPENVDKLLETARQEITKLITNGPDKKDLDKVKNQWHEQHRDLLKENGYWRGKLEDILYWGRNKNHVLNYDKWIDSLTPAEVQEAAKVLLSGENEFVSILYPEEVKK